MATDPIFNNQGYAEAIKKEVLKRDKTILASTFSVDGDYLICGSNKGYIAVWYLPKYFSTESPFSSAQSGPDLVFKAFDGAVYCLESIIIQHNIIIISGGQFSVKAWSWADITNKIASKAQDKYIKLVFELKNPVPTAPNAFSFLAETNAVSFDHSRSVLYTACGDNKAYAWDIERQTVQRSFDGHSSYLHCLKLSKQKQQLFTGSEDGTVRIWDPNVKEQLAILDPVQGTALKASKEAAVSNSNWVSCLDLDSSSDWLVCGGGKYLSLWYLPMQHVTSYLPMLAPVQDVFFYEDSIVSVGLEDSVYSWKLNGSLVSRAESSSKAIYTAKYNTSGHNRVMVTAGASNDIDLYYSFSRRAFSLSWIE
jgi:WD40 repeat protein